MIERTILERIDELTRTAVEVRDAWIELGFPGSPAEDPEEQPLEVIRLGWASMEAVPALLSEREEMDRTLRLFEEERLARASPCPCCGGTPTHRPGCPVPGLIG
jgi:hypothetical protein